MYKDGKALSPILGSMARHSMYRGHPGNTRLILSNPRISIGNQNNK